MAWGVNNNGWWGEGEIKFYMDGDREFPTICGTGTEDYFCGSYNFDVGKENGGYREFTTPYAGLPQVIRPDGLYRSQTRFGLYRWHIMDPIRFEQDLRVTIQALGWRSGRALPAAAGRHRLGRLLVSDAADRAVPGAAGARTTWKSSSFTQEAQDETGRSSAGVVSSGNRLGRGWQSPRPSRAATPPPPELLAGLDPNLERAARRTARHCDQGGRRVLSPVDRQDGVTMHARIGVEQANGRPGST